MSIQNKPIEHYVTLIASIVTIFNFLVAFPINSSWDTAFSTSFRSMVIPMRVVLVFIFEGALAYAFGNLLALIAKRTGNLLSSLGFLATLIVCLISSWVSFYNITKLLISRDFREIGDEGYVLVFFIAIFALIIASIFISSHMKEQVSFTSNKVHFNSEKAIIIQALCFLVMFIAVCIG